MFSYLHPDALAREAREFRQKLAASQKALAALGEIKVGPTPKTAVYREDKLVLYRYEPRVKRPEAVPLLIVYALVNRPYMLDLQEDRSLIRGLLEQGLDVYLIDWGYPDAADRYLALADYIDGYLHRCVAHIGRRHGSNALHLLGVCQGGVLAACYAALHPERVKTLTTMVAPFDFHTPDNVLSLWARDLDVDLLVEVLGNVPGEWLNGVFVSLRPLRLTGQKYVAMLDRLDQPEALKYFLRMEQWIFDSPDQAGECFRQFIQWFFQQNRLIEDRLEIDGRAVRLSRLKMPILNVYATRDHLVPPAASRALREAVGTDDYTEQAFAGGHIGLYVSARAQREIPPAIAAWLKRRMERPLEN